MKNIIYSRTSALRDPKFKIRTTIELVDGRKVVNKQSIDTQSKKHVEGVVKNYKKLKDNIIGIKLIKPEATKDGVCMEFIDGTRLDKRVYEFAINDSIDDLHNEIDKVINAINSLPTKETSRNRYTSVFGEVFLKSTEHVSLGYFDYNLDNFIVYNDDLYLIDYEWLFDFSIPKDLILTRVFYYLIQQLAPIYKTKASPSCPVVGVGDLGFLHQESYTRYKPYLKNLSGCYIAEQNLQNYVRGMAKPIVSSGFDFESITIHTSPIFPSITNQLEHAESRLSQLEELLTFKDDQLRRVQNESNILNEELLKIRGSKLWKVRNRIKDYIKKLNP